MKEPLVLSIHVTSLLRPEHRAGGDCSSAENSHTVVSELIKPQIHTAGGTNHIPPNWYSNKKMAALITGSAKRRLHVGLRFFLLLVCTENFMMLVK